MKQVKCNGTLYFPVKNLLLFMGLKDERNKMKAIKEKLAEYIEEIKGEKYVSLDNIRRFADEMLESGKYYMYSKEQIYYHLLEQIEYWTETGYVELKYML